MQRTYKLAVIGWLLAFPAFAGPPSIDTFGITLTHINNPASQSTITAPITTNQSPDLAVLDFYAPAASGSVGITTVDGCNSTGSGCTGPLTWKRRYQYQTSQATCGDLVNIACVDSVERWTAVANATVNRNLTVVVSQAVFNAEADTYGVFGLANVNSPYDPSFANGPLETQNTNAFTGTSSLVGVTVTTSFPNDLVLAVGSSPFWISGDGFIECNHGSVTCNAWTLLAPGSTIRGSPPKVARMTIAYKQFAPTITSTTYGFKNQADAASTCAGLYVPFEFVLDVMTGTASGGGGSSVLQFQTPW